MSASTSESSATRLGIIGGGQLGFYLCQAAQAQGLSTAVLTRDGADPALTVADRGIVANYDDVRAADILAADVDLITFEVEDVSPEVLKTLAAAASQGRVEVYPDPAVMLRLQNKALQKSWLVANGLPTAYSESWTKPDQHTEDLNRRFEYPFVQKTQCGGYDGRGVQIIREPAQLSSIWPVPSIIEEYQAGAMEIAVLVARSHNGEIRSYDPIALSFHETLNVLDEAHAPAAIPMLTAQRAVTLAETAIERLGGVGVFAVEMFILPRETLLINEVSPRVHNAGHHTLDAAETSQFEQHVRAILGRPLGNTELKARALMKNLLSDPAQPISVLNPGSWKIPGESTVHWYGKSPSKPWRKQGHLTVLHPEQKQIAQLMTQALGSVTDTRRLAS